MRARYVGRLAATALLAVAALGLGPAPASAAFGFLPGPEGFAVAFEKEDASPETRAGAHPHSLALELGFETTGGFADGDLRDLRISPPPGLLFNPTAIPVCSAADFRTPRLSPFEQSASGESCPHATQLGTVAVHSGSGGGETRHFGLFNLGAPHGAPAALGASPHGSPLVFRIAVREADGGLDLVLANRPQAFDLQRLELHLWGTPWATAHDPDRGNCLNEQTGGSFGKCLALGAHNAPLDEIKSYLTLPTTPCGAPLSSAATAGSWQGAKASQSAQIPALIQCNQSLTVPKVQLTGDAASSGTGLRFTLDVNDGGGILNPGGFARPAIRRAVVSLPEGLTLNPSVAAGLGSCSPEGFARESVGSDEGAGCPNAAKVGEVRIEGMLGLPEPIAGSLYVAEPYRNPFGSLLALYIVARDPARGLFVTSAGRVDPDPRTGRLTIAFEGLPRLLYTRFVATLREGQRPMLVTPPACATYTADVQMSSWAGSNPHPLTEGQSSFAIVRGVGGGPCPAPGRPPFNPGLVAGSLNPNAAAYTPVHLRMTRTDQEQALVSYGAKLPPGLLAKIAGVATCPEAAIAAAEAKSAQAEIADPSCPASSRIATTLVGGGVGGVLAWAPGALYLAGPHAGAPLSVVAITAAQIGPFDLGTVLVRAVPRFDSSTAQVIVDAAGSDPIPHILAGIPIHVRDIRVDVDRPSFTLNPTSCDPFLFTSILGGAGADPFNRGDDVLATSTDRFQLLNCSALGFKPRLKMRVKGPSRRGGFPSLRATYRPRPGDANLKRAAATLPPSFFLEQGHIAGVCSNVQFERGVCPKSSVYGHAVAHTPLLAEPLRGKVHLRSSRHRLPDLVADLRGLVDVEVVGRIGSRGGLHASFDSLPDAPVSKFVLRMRGGRRSLIVNSRELCAGRSRAKVELDAQNGKLRDFRPVVRPQCGKRGAEGGP